jgi:hypothetical protein
MSFAETFFYAAPKVTCAKCWADIPLPYPDLPLTDHDHWTAGEYESPMETIPDEWKITLGCRECGHVETYPGWHVGDWLVERPTRGKFHNDANMFSVGMRCAKMDCKAPATLHTNLKDGEVEKEFLGLLKQAFFHGSLPCGHQIMPIPECYYADPHRVLSRLW